MATFGVRTGADLSAFVGRWVKFTAPEIVGLNTTPGTASEGVLVRVYTFAGVQWVQIDSGVDEHKVQTGGAFVAGDPLTNDALGRSVLAAGPDVVLALALEASAGAGELRRAFAFSGGSGGGAPAVPTLSQVLAVGNLSGPSDILLAAGQALDADTVGGTLELGTTNALNFSIGGPNGGTGLGEVFINQGGIALHGSNSGIQYSSTFSSRAQLRVNQYGPNAGVPGISTFKSRGATVGSLAAVVAGDVIFRATAVGVCGDNASIPLSGLISIQVATAGVFATYIATEYELQLVPLEGPINGRKVMFKVTSQGVPVLRETALPAGGTAAGIAILDGAGQLLIADPSVKAGTRFTLTAQDGGALLTGSLRVTARVVGASFTISSTLGAADAGVHVYYQLWEGI